MSYSSVDWHSCCINKALWLLVSELALSKCYENLLKGCSCNFKIISLASLYHFRNAFENIRKHKCWT